MLYLLDSVNPYACTYLLFQLQDVKGGRLLGPLRRQLPRPHVHEGEGQGVPALRQIRVHAAEVVHARHRVHLQQVPGSNSASFNCL